jgi:hypothetical protein
MKQFVFWGCLVVMLVGGESQVVIAHTNSADNDYKYDVKNIPAALSKDAEAVVRDYDIQFEVKSENRAVEKVRRVVTVFKKDKRDYGYLLLAYSNFTSLEGLEGKIYDAGGKLVRELKDKDTKDYCAYDGFSLFRDLRVRVAEFYHDQYPYTVEFTYEYEYNGYLNWPEWFSRTSRDPIEHSKMEVVLPKDSTLRYWCNRDSVRPNVFIDGNKKHYVWESFAAPFLTKEAAGSEIEDVATVVHLAPTNFKFDDYRGDMTSWKTLGQWEYGLYKGRDVLPESAIHDVHAFVDTLNDPREKAKALYQYMQKRTRYVSVQLGIGGWQPFEASFVHEHSYGDCKALSNYMVALLKEAGIQAYPYVIHSGSDPYPFIKEFPSNQSNHAMVCIPLKDTVWLECTNQSIPFGHISCSTENRGVLLLTPEGGVVAYTPKTTPQQNEQRRTATVSLSYYGSTSAIVNVTRSGDQQDYVRGALYDESPEERERWITNDLTVPNATLNHYSIHGLDTHELSIGIDVQITLARFASVSGDRMFFQPNLMERRTYVPADIPERLAPIRYNYPYHDVDSICYVLPSGYAVESLPAEVSLQPSFGEFHTNTIVLGDTVVVYKRSLEIHAYSIPAKNYTEYRKFFMDVVKADRAQVVLVRKK